jgi:plasmid maintenance system antidote protein VapI
MHLPKIKKAELLKILDQKNTKTLHPGEVLEKVFNFLDVNYKDVALRMQVWPLYLHEIIETLRDIGEEDDKQLSRILGIPRGFLMNMQAEYDEFKHKEHKLWLTKYQQNTL